MSQGEILLYWTKLRGRTGIVEFGSGGSTLLALQCSSAKIKGISPVELTRIYAGSADRIAWPIELRLDPQGRPIALFSTRNNDRWKRRRPGFGGYDHRYLIGHFDGDRWKVRELCYAGSRLYAGEEDYTGLASLDSADPRIVIISSNVDPRSGRPLQSATDGLQHWELFIGLVDNGNQNIRWMTLTKNSDRDNIRPLIVSVGTTHSLLLWMRGKYKSYRDFDTDIIGWIYNRQDLSLSLLGHADEAIK